MTEYSDEEVEEWLEELCGTRGISIQTAEEFFEWCVFQGKFEYELEDGWYLDREFEAFTRETVIERLKNTFGAFSERYVEYVEDRYGGWVDPECDEEADLQWKDEFIAHSSDYRSYINYGVDYERQLKLFPELFEKKT